jgi:hypothetical protein
MHFVVEGESAKKAFITAKEIFFCWSSYLEEEDTFEDCKRYRIVDTNLYSEQEALLLLKTTDFTKLKIKNRTAYCYLLHNNKYLFYYKKKE